jgi:hypothetical protein
MKKLFLFTLALAMVMASYAQPVYKSINRMNTPYETVMLDTSGMNAGASGAKQLWDFSKAVSLNQTSEVKYVPASSCAGFANFPSADIALPTGSDRYLFYDTANGKWSKVGQYFNEEKPTVIAYSNPQASGVPPFTYQYTFSDDFEGTYTGPKGNAKRTGTSTLTADGYGTIITPAGTFKNALRMKFTESIKDSFDPQRTGSTNVIFYYWLAEGVPYPVFSIYTAEIRATKRGTPYVYKNATYSKIKKK